MSEEKKRYSFDVSTEVKEASAVAASVETAQEIQLDSAAFTPKITVEGHHLLQFFPQEFIDLQKEIQEHPPLMQHLADNYLPEWEMRLGQIAAYCEIALDDTYSPQDILKLCTILTQKLIEDRTILVPVDGAQLIQ